MDRFSRDCTRMQVLLHFFLNGFAIIEVEENCGFQQNPNYRQQFRFIPNASKA
jgi:hypothetical protein